MSPDTALIDALKQAKVSRASLKRARDQRVCSMFNGCNTMVEIATAMGMSVKTVSAILRKAGKTQGQS